MESIVMPDSRTWNDQKSDVSRPSSTISGRCACHTVDSRVWTSCLTSSIHSGEALHLLRMSGAFYCRCEFTGPWGLVLPEFPTRRCSTS